MTVLVNGDLLDEGNETFFLNLTNAANATIADGQGLGTITNDDGAPGLSVNDVTVTEGDSGTTNATFTVTLAPASGQNVSVDYATADGTATAPADYAATSGTLTFAPGQTTKTVTVPVDGRHARRARRDVHAQPLERGQRGDRRPDRARHDHRRRPAAGDLDQRRDRDRGRTRAPSTRRSRSASTRRAGARSPSTTRPPTAPRPRRPTTRPAQRHADVHAGPDLEAGHGAGQRRPARRGERDLLRQPHEPVERDDRRRPGRGHDHRRRPAAVAVDQRRHRHRGQHRARRSRTSRSR